MIQTLTSSTSVTFLLAPVWFFLGSLFGIVLLICLALFERVDSGVSEEFLDPSTPIEASQLFIEGKS